MHPVSVPKQEIPEPVNIVEAKPLFYKNPVPLSKEQHGDLYIDSVRDYSHTRETNSIYIAAVEFFKAVKDYTIVFGKNAEGNVFPAVLLGLINNKNHYLNDKGEWTVDYIPAYIRRYPFILATSPGDVGTYAVCIDDSYVGLNCDKKGEALYDKNGEKTDTLKTAIEFLKEYQRHIQATSDFCKVLKDANLLEPMQAKVTIDGEERSLGGFLCVNRELLKGLRPAQLAEMMLAGHLELIYAHLFSLANLNRLIERQDLEPD